MEDSWRIMWDFQGIGLVNKCRLVLSCFFFFLYQKRIPGFKESLHCTHAQTNLCSYDCRCGGEKKPAGMFEVPGSTDRPTAMTDQWKLMHAHTLNKHSGTHICKASCLPPPFTREPSLCSCKHTAITI